MWISSPVISELVDRLVARQLAQVVSVFHGKATATNSLKGLNCRLFAIRYQPVDRQRSLFPGLCIGNVSPSQKLLTLMWVDYP